MAKNLKGARLFLCIATMNNPHKMEENPLIYHGFGNSYIMPTN